MTAPGSLSRTWEVGAEPIAPGSLKPLDRWLQRWRIARAGRWIAPGSRVLDIGCHDGALFRALRSRVRDGVGIDVLLRGRFEGDGYRLVPGHFPEAFPETEPFDVITLLAVLEHVPREEQAELALGCARHLRPGGLLVITTPTPAVDRILDVLLALRLVRGMSLDDHYGFEPDETPGIFLGRGFEPVAERRFQLGLNRLFVFRRTAG